MSMETDALLPKSGPRMPLRDLRARIAAANRYMVGVVLLLVVLWTASNFITNDLETGDNSWNKPFLITYLNTSSFAIYLIPVAWRHWRRRSSNNADRASYRALATDEHLSASPLTLVRSLSPASPRASLATLDPEDAAGIVSAQPLPKLTVRETAEIAAWWSAVWFLANWSLNAALAWASVASVTILSSTSSFFTLTLGRIFGVEQVTRAKVVSALVSFAGVILVTRSDAKVSLNSSHPPTHPILGDLASLLSAAFYAVYVILLKVRLGDESRADTQLMLGFAGLFNIVFLIPVFPILHYLGWETFELPPTREAVIICVINMLITLSSDYLYVLAMLKTTPMVVTIGLSLTIPFALVGSLFIPSANKDSVTLMSVAGAALVVGSFAVLGLEGLEESKVEGQRHNLADEEEL